MDEEFSILLLEKGFSAEPKQCITKGHFYFAKNDRSKGKIAPTFNVELSNKLEFYVLFGFINSPIIAPPIMHTAPIICIMVIFSPSNKAAKTTADKGSK